MQTEDDLRPRLRRQLKAAVRDRDRIAVSALRDGIAALDKAEAIAPGRTFRLRAVKTSRWISWPRSGRGRTPNS